MQIKTALRFHLAPVRMAKFENPGDRINWSERIDAYRDWTDNQGARVGLTYAISYVMVV